MENLKVVKIAVMLVVLASFFSSCSDDIIEPTKSIITIDNVGKSSSTNEQHNEKSIITIDNVGRVQTSNEVIIITHVTVYSKFNVMLFDWAGCGTNDCQIDPTFVSSLPSDTYRVDVTLYNTTTQITTLVSRNWII
jgi:hypothetical protein